MTRSSVFFLSKEPQILRQSGTAVSLHGHTLHSRECLGFIPRLSARIPPLDRSIYRLRQKYRACHGADLDLSRAWWTPPISARDAWRLETHQIQETLQMHSLVSLTDHDNIDSSGMLHRREETKGTPISIEWTVPFGPTFFHLGIHNLPAQIASRAVSAMNAFSGTPSDSQLTTLLEWLHSYAEILIVLNHPLWDEKGNRPAVAWCSSGTICHHL